MKISGKMSQSSRRWLNRQQSDPYVKKANREGYRSRAAFKLLEIDDKFSLLDQAENIVDLGAAPGGWSQVIARKLSPKLCADKARAIALDLLPFTPMENITQLIGDFEDEKIQAALVEFFGGNGVDLVLSDMAPATVGHAQTDHLRIMGLAEEAYRFSLNVMNQNASLVVKIFQGGEEKKFVDSIRRDFKKVCFFKPKSSRSMSAEIYVVAIGYQKCK